MRRLASLASVLATTLIARAPAQAPITADSLKNIVDQVARISRQTDSVRHYGDTLQTKAHELILDFADHNKEPCEYPQGQPELCEDFDMTRFMLNNRSADLQKELKANVAGRHALRDRFDDLMMRLATGTYAPDVAAKRRSVVACAALDAIPTAAACLRKIQPAATYRSP
jgi:hypothetical protein